ncbi:hypothetical protein B0T21DRAFT_317319 [Apiosordaria backusii]|uniref:DNA (cytosine-5-)-methyltransferase n=1 Tax=Apiosordaria backusii TaxID=314023 RepID=A0AA40AT40_9PEZI|nr:hypothetical protein B0T21DRAFT_317319 [Apiosordaria backusii]
MTLVDSWPSTGRELEFGELIQHDETEAAILNRLLPTTLEFLPLIQDPPPAPPPAPSPEPPKECSQLLPECAPSHLASPQPITPGNVLSEATAAAETPDLLPDQTPSNQELSVQIPVSTLITPRSQYDGFIPPLPVTKERVAVEALKEAHGSVTEKEFIEFDLDQFSFYVVSAPYPLEMRSLQYMDTRKGYDRYYFDGVLSYRGQKYYVQRVEVAELPIGNYGVEHPSVEGEIWVRSVLNSKKEIYYRLGKPTVEYKRFYKPFVWAVDLGKHSVDYAAWLLGKGQEVRLEVFKQSFSEWLGKTHGKSAVFWTWRRQYPGNDFRTAVVNNIRFIWKEMNGIHGPKKAESMRLFRQAMDLEEYKQNKAAPALPMIEEGDEMVAPTIVTPYIKQLFGEMVFGKVLHAVESSDGGLRTPVPALDAVLSTPQLEMESKIPGRRRGVLHFLPLEVTDRIQVGDTISTPHDDETTDTKWRKTENATDHRWFGLVQKIHTAKDGTRSFDVIWLYRPAETPCCLMRYPWQNELFLSDHCTCEEGRDRRVKEHEVLEVHKVNWFGTPESSGGDFFVRQTYIVEHRRWVSLQESHIRCSHGTEKLGSKTGDTVLVRLNSSDSFTEPCEIVKVFKQGKTIFVRLRRLFRREKIDSSARAAPANELVYTDKFVVTKPDKIIGRCHIRVFQVDTPIPSPYNRKGTGNLFYITHRMDEAHEQLVPLEHDFPITLRQSFDPQGQEFRRLRGMDLFCGSGNLGRGLEDGGAVEMLWASDICRQAIHTYMANSPNPDLTRPFFGSVDDLLRLALEGKFSGNVPRPGDVELISAGSPCPGFSLLTNDKKNLKQAKNQSMVASFAAFIDFYRPKYAILENVAAIVQARHNRTQDTLSQLFCAVVGLGYQAQLVLGDAWTHGAPQSRNRVFLLIAAPGSCLPEAPPSSHSHHPAAKTRGVGELCNGEAYVRRSFDPTPLKYVSSSEATADLPAIIDGMVDACISYPDHRLSFGYTHPIRAQAATIPIFPYGMNFVKTYLKGGDRPLTKSDRDLFPAEGLRVALTAQGWSRLSPKEVFPTITTQSKPTDARTGGALHWQENRPFTVMEGRRAQGFLDEEVLLGTGSEKWRLVGNSVSRHMALALGLKLREAWVGGLEDNSRRGTRESTRGVSEGVSEHRVKREEWEEIAGLVITDVVTEVENVMVNGHGKRRRLSEDVIMSAGENCTKIQRIETRVEDVVMTGATAEAISVTSSTSEVRSEPDRAPQSSPSPITSPEKSPERSGQQSCEFCIRTRRSDSFEEALHWNSITQAPSYAALEVGGIFSSLVHSA